MKVTVPVEVTVTLLVSYGLTGRSASRDAAFDVLVRGEEGQRGERFQIEPFCDCILPSAACSYRKPHPRICELALAHWNIPPQEIAMVGDSLAADVRGAQGLGLFTVWITRRVSKTATSSQVKPDAETRTLHELPALFSRLSA